jgi:glycosyltransferase involved in cell wall biosynthesis
MRTWPYVRSKAIHFEVITTCTNLDLFKPTPEHQKGTASPFVLGYVGNAGPGYLFDPVVRSFLEMRRRRPDAMLRIINRRDHVYIRETLSRYGVDENCIDLRGVEHNEVPRQMASMDAGVFFIRPDPSRISSVPTRMGEFLACGVPCLGNAGVGDVEEVLEGHRVGVVLRDFETGSISSAVDQLLQMATDTSVRQRCVETARLCSSLEAGVQTYDRIYRELSSGAT